MFSFATLYLFAVLATPRAVPTPKEQQCRVDADCAVTALDCCGCTAGGAGVPINRRALPAFARRQATSCSATVCPAVLSTHASCESTPRCVARRCQLTLPIGGTCASAADCPASASDEMCKARAVSCAPPVCLEKTCTAVLRSP